MKSRKNVPAPLMKPACSDRQTSKTGTQQFIQQPVRDRPSRRKLSGAFLRLLRLLRGGARALALLCGLPAAVLIAVTVYLSAALPDTYYLDDPSDFSLAQYRILVPVAEEETAVEALIGTAARADEDEKLRGSLSGAEEEKSIRYRLMLGGVIPVKTVAAVESETRYVIPSGSIFGLKMLTEGAVVAALSPVETETGTVCPAREAGLRAGDIILTAGGEEITSFDTLSSVITVAGESGGRVSITYRRDGKEGATSLSPVRAVNGGWLAGLWIRDSTAGIGTVTFTDPYSGCFAALGHGVCDADTGVLLPLQWGKVCGATILGVKRGTAGTPGELQGAFLDSSFTLSELLGRDGVISSGSVLANLPCGIIVRADSALSGFAAAGHEEALTAVCPRQEVHTGEAQILSTIGGNTAQLFSAQIEKVSYSEEDASRNIVLRITDPVLIAATGGIVQGMSGSPILQGGKLVGAVTHVFVSDPEKGYGIFAETMLDALEEYG